MLQILEVTLKRGGAVVFDTLDLTIHPGHKVGIVGRNGAGKTTLFELIRGRLLPEEGDLKLPRAWQIAWLEQDIEPSDRSALDFTIDGDVRLRAVERAMAKAESAEDHHKLATLYAEFEDAGGYSAEARAGEILHGLAHSPCTSPAIAPEPFRSRPLRRACPSAPAWA